MAGRYDNDPIGSILSGFGRNRDIKTLGAERYRIIGLAGKGAMAHVYHAYDTNQDRDVAIKLLSLELSSEASFLARFKRESELMRNLNHPNILKAYDYGQDGDKIYLVMDYYGGGTLQDRLSQDRLDLPQIADYLHQIAAGLDYAHSRNIIHRDIKPSNVLIHHESGDLALSDFGIAKALSGTNSSRTGTIMGTPLYMAPEQFLDRVDKRSDIYSLGVMLYEMLCGSVPFQGDGIGFKHLHDPIPPLRTHGADYDNIVERVVQKALAKRPEARFQTAKALASAFQEALDVLSQTQAHSSTELLETMPIAHAPRNQLVVRTDANRPYVPLSQVDDFKTGPMITSEVVAIPPMLKARPRRRNTGLVVLGSLFLVVALSVLGLTLFYVTDQATPILPTVINNTKVVSTAVSSGLQVAFTSQEVNGKTRIYTYDPQRKVFSILSSQESDSLPSLTSDGSLMVFQRDKPNGNHALYRYATNGALSLLVDDARQPEFAHNSNQLVYTNEKDNELYILNLGSAQTTRLTATAGMAKRGAGWSFDDQQIAFSMQDDQNIYQIYLFEIASSHLTKLTNFTNEYAFWPNFSPDNNRIVFNTATADATNPLPKDIYTIDAVGVNVPVKLTSATQKGNSHPLWIKDEFGKDGTRIYFNSDSASGKWSRIWAMNSDGSAPSLFIERKDDLATNDYAVNFARR